MRSPGKETVGRRRGPARLPAPKLNGVSVELLSDTDTSKTSTRIQRISVTRSIPGRPLPGRVKGFRTDNNDRLGKTVLDMSRQAI